MNKNQIEQERFGEVVYDLTITCQQKLQDKYGDSRLVLETIMAWAHEFEDWWNSLSEEEQERRDYILSVDKFGERHLRAELGEGLKDWELALEQANNDICGLNKEIIVKEEEKGYYNLYINDNHSRVTVYAQNYFEHELEDLVKEAWADVLAESKRMRKKQPKRYHVFSVQSDLCCEDAFGTTLDAGELHTLLPNLLKKYKDINIREA